MKLLRCHVENFGILSDFDLTFTEGLNVLCRENGFGKSTWRRFSRPCFTACQKPAPRRANASAMTPGKGENTAAFWNLNTGETNTV